PAHKLFGQSYVDRVLVLDCAKGGVATAWMLHEMKARQMLPLAIVLNRANPIMAQGAALAGMALLAGFDGDITAQVPAGAVVEVDPVAGLLRIVDSSPPHPSAGTSGGASAGMPAGYRKIHGP
ncbi:MAG: DUF126 domain-containing protein, partial [Burkholderiaceae bacterium]